MAAKFEMTSDFSKVLADYEKLQRSTVRLEGQIAKVVAETKKHEAAHETAFTKMRADATSMVASYVSFDAVVRVVADAFSFMKKEVDSAVGSMAKLADSRRELAQVATGAQDLQSLERKADEIATSSGMTREESRKLLMDARSLGFEGAAPTIAKYRDVFPTEEAGTVAGKLPAIFPTATPEKALEETFVAAQKSAATVSDFAKYIPTVSEGVALAGGTMEESLGVFQVASSQFATASTAADRMKGFFARLSLEKDLTGTAFERVEQFQRLPEERKQEFLGNSQELNVAFATIQRLLPEMKAAAAEAGAVGAQAGTAATPMAQARAAFFDPTTEAGRHNLAFQESEQAARRREVSTERRFAEQGAAVQTARDQSQALLNQAGAGIAGKFVAARAAGAVEGLGLPVESGFGTGALTKLGQMTEASIFGGGIFDMRRMFGGGMKSLPQAAGELFGAGAAPGGEGNQAVAVDTEANAIRKQQKDLAERQAKALDRIDQHLQNVTRGPLSGSSATAAASLAVQREGR